MRDPIDVSQYNSCPLDSLASLDPPLHSLAPLDPRFRASSNVLGLVGGNSSYHRDNLLNVVDETDLLIMEPCKYWLPTFPYADPFSLFTRLATIYLSDTSNQDLGRLKKLYLSRTLLLTSRPIQYQLPQHLKSFKVVCTLDLKPFYLVALLETLKGETCIVFTSSIKSADWLCTVLNSFEDLQIKIKVYSRRQAQPIRSKTLGEFRTGKIQVLICPDETERAVEVEEVKNVINYDLPAHSTIYVHRACQTARAGQSGNCFTLLTEEEVTKLKSLLHLAGNESCADYPIPSKAAESFHATYVKGFTYSFLQ